VRAGPVLHAALRPGRAHPGRCAAPCPHARRRRAQACRDRRTAGRHRGGVGSRGRTADGTPRPRGRCRGDARAALEEEQRTLLARRGALLDERAALQKEQAELASLRTRTATGPLQPQDPQGLSPLDLGGQNAQVSSGQSFNPAISVIPDIAYYNDDVAGAAFEIVEDMDAFGGGSVDADPGGHGHGALERGFNLREMEVAFSGAVDPYFDVWAVLAIAPTRSGRRKSTCRPASSSPGCSCASASSSAESATSTSSTRTSGTSWTRRCRCRRCSAGRWWTRACRRPGSRTCPSIRCWASRPCRATTRACRTTRPMPSGSVRGDAGAPALHRFRQGLARPRIRPRAAGRYVVRAEPKPSGDRHGR